MLVHHNRVILQLAQTQDSRVDALGASQISQPENAFEKVPIKCIKCHDGHMNSHRRQPGNKLPQVQCSLAIALQVRSIRPALNFNHAEVHLQAVAELGQSSVVFDPGPQSQVGPSPRPYHSPADRKKLVQPH